MNKPKITEVDPAEVPEVQQHLEAKQRLESLMAAYPGVFEEYAESVNVYNATLEAAEQKVRALGVTCGPIKILSYSTKFNAQALYDSMGRDSFLQVGGSEQTIKQYDVDKKIFEAAVVQGKVPSNVISAVVTTAPSYKVPKKIVLP